MKMTNAVLDAQLDFLRTYSLVPTESGGAQLEWHRDRWDIEVEFDPDGKICGVLVARENAPAPADGEAGK